MAESPNRPPDPRRGTGRHGESAAAAWLRLHGYLIVAQNWRCRAGEIDIVARDGGTLVFVEVKARTSRAAGLPEESVTPAKRRRLVRLARRFLLDNGLHDVPCRFDVVTVERGMAGVPAIRHHEAAFRADGY